MLLFSFLISQAFKFLQETEAHLARQFVLLTQIYLVQPSHNIGE